MFPPFHWMPNPSGATASPHARCPFPHSAHTCGGLLSTTCCCCCRYYPVALTLLLLMHSPLLVLFFPQLHCHCCFHMASHCRPIAGCADHAGSRISCFPPPPPFLFHAHSCCSQSTATAIPCHPFPFTLTLSGQPRLTKHKPTGSSLWSAAASPTKTHNTMHCDPPLPVSPSQEALVRCIAGHHPESGRQGTVRVTMANIGGPFATQRPLPSVQSASGGMMTALTAPPATSCSSGTTLGPPTALGTNKDASSTRVGTHFAGISSDPAAVQVKDTTMSVPAVVTPAMEPKTAPAVNTLLTHLQSRAQMPYNVDGWQESLIASDLVHKYPTLCYNPFPSSFHFTLYSYSLSTHLER